MTVNYEQQFGLNKESITQTGDVGTNGDFAFYIPYTVNYDSVAGVWLTVHALGGVRVMRVRIRNSPECFHIWGTTLIPYWSAMNCW
jgi:hypothetical protein